MTAVLPVVPNGSYQAQGILQGINTDPRLNNIYVSIELNAAVPLEGLIDGVSAQVAVYSPHFSHIAVLRRVLLRMTSWTHYLYLDH